MAFCECAALLLLCCCAVVLLPYRCSSRHNRGRIGKYVALEMQEATMLALLKQSYNSFDPVLSLTL
jgi:hypothetical protein